MKKLSNYIQEAFLIGNDWNEETPAENEDFVEKFKSTLDIMVRVNHFASADFIRDITSLKLEKTRVQEIEEIFDKVDGKLLQLIPYTDWTTNKYNDMINYVIQHENDMTFEVSYVIEWAKYYIFIFKTSLGIIGIIGPEEAAPEDYRKYSKIPHIIFKKI